MKKVLDWIDQDNEVAKQAFEASAAEVINKLKAIDEKLTKTFSTVSG